jgi:hypothetical protein
MPFFSPFFLHFLHCLQFSQYNKKPSTTLSKQLQ